MLNKFMTENNKMHVWHFQVENWSLHFVRNIDILVKTTKHLNSKTLN